MIPGDLLSACPHRQFHTLPGLLDSWAALPNSNPNACMPMQGGSLYHFYDGLWYDPAERRTHDLPCERRTRYRLSQPDTVSGFIEDLLRIGQKLHKITHDSMKNRGSTPILTNLVGVHPRNIHTKFEANPCSGLREVEKLKSSRRRQQRRRTQPDR